MSPVASSSRRNTGIALSVAIALGTAGFCGSAHAAVIANDSFSYTAGAALAGQNGGTGWGAAWAVNTGAATAWTGAAATTNGAASTFATNLDYSGFSTGTSGGSATVAASTATGGTAGALFRTFATPISTTASNTFWGSVEFQAKGNIKFQNFYQLTFNDTPTTNANGVADALGTANGSMHALPLLAIGAGPVNASNSGSGAPTYYADSDGGAGVQLNAAADDNLHYFAFQIMTGVTDPSNSSPAVEVVTYADPTSSDPSTWIVKATQFYDLSAAEQAGTITGVQYQSSNQATTTSNRFMFMDEVKFGTTAQDVGAGASVATPEPASLGALAIGGLALLARRRKA